MSGVWVMVSVLFVDDDESLLEIYRQYFGELKKLEVYCAGSAQGARSLVGSHRINVAFIDVRLNEQHDPFSGLELAEFLSLSQPSCSIFLLTASAEPMIRSLAGRIGAQVLYKPKPLASLDSIIMLGSGSTRRSNEEVGNAKTLPISPLSGG